MPRLILLNGPPAIGKSTLAQRLVQDHPLALNLDIDGLRRSLGRWDEHDGSKAIARGLAKVLALSHLTAGHDVVLPQLLLRDDAIEEFRNVAAEARADFVEIVLLASKTDSVERFRRRRADLAASGEMHPEMHIEPGKEDEAVLFSDARLRAMAASRASVHVIETTNGAVDGAYGAVAEVLTGYDQLFGNTS